MIKKLDRLVIRAFIGPFIATFFLTLFVLIIQFFWLYIDDFVGKGLGANTVLEFIWFQTASLVPLALPLAILLSSIMTFGTLGENFELVAIKSAGISLLRFMRPLLVISIFICGIAFLFSNYIIPVANLRSRTLLADIIYAKPAFDLKEGVFYDKLNGFAIKIGKKEKNDSSIRDIIVYEQGNPLQDNFIIAKSGVMRVTADKRFLEFRLRDGWRYQERTDNSGKTEYIRLHFDEYNKQFDLSSFQFNRTADSVNRSNERMLSMRQLEIAIDSMSKANDTLRKQTEREMYAPFPFVKWLDNSSTASTVKMTKEAARFEDLIPDSARILVSRRALGMVNSLRVSAESINGLMKERERNLRWHEIEWHRKISLSLACLVLFLVGAPLGSIIRRGGLGLPLIFAIAFFMLFYFLNTSGEKNARINAMTPFFGMWLATFVILPIGLFLTYKAMHEAQLFSREFYYRFSRKIGGLIQRK